MTVTQILDSIHSSSINEETNNKLEPLIENGNINKTLNQLFNQ